MFDDDLVLVFIIGVNKSITVRVFNYTFSLGTTERIEKLRMVAAFLLFFFNLH